ncbi:MAG: N-6 DNA methylase [Pseudomonadota bacterium]
MTEFAKLIGITISALSTDFDDFLGAIASEQEWLNEDAGQFFTPYHLCRAIAKMTLGDIKAHLQEKGTPITVSEPACGGGALVIACAHEAYEQGVDPRAHFVFDCQDVSRNSFNMTYIQLSAIGLQAVVHHGNTLSMEIWEHRVTMQHRLYLNWLKEQCQIQRLEMMRDLIVNPALLLEEQAAQSEQYEGASAQPDTEETPTAPKTETEQPQGQLSIFDAETEISAAPAETAKPQKSKPAIQLPPPEQRQLGLFDGQKQAGK